ncbi:DUF4153 domain-containing protein [Campylobacter concisus]|uniref:DUF4153 domain-containing protein n=1 Tax=Campylobacter concisus TaxID=199 RepID=UPI001CE472C0|nr:DUF4153 domain-containing protein [Campylobacter concisus]
MWLNFILKRTTLQIITELKAAFADKKILFLTILAFSLATIFLSPSQIVDEYRGFWLLEPLLLVAIYLNKRQILLPLYFLIFGASLYFFGFKLSGHASDLVALYLIAFVLLLSLNFANDNEKFIRGSLARLLNLLISFALFHLFFLGIVAVFAGLNYLFDWELLTSHRTQRLYLTLASFGLPCLFLFFESKFREYRLLNFIKIAINFILNPLLIIYVVLLNLYCIYRLVLLELPRGGVAYIVLACLIAGFVLRGLNLLIKSQIYDQIFKLLPLFVILPSVLLWWGVMHRVGEYGLSEPRIYLIACVIFANLSYFVMIFFRDFPYKFLAFFMVFGIFFTHFVLDTKQIVLNSQKELLLRELKALNLLGSDGTLSGDVSKIGEEKLYFLQDKFDYLVENGDKFALENKKFIAGLEAVEQKKWQIFSINSGNIGINVKDATIKSVVTSSVNGDELVIQLDNERVSINMQKHLEKALASLNLKPDGDFGADVFEQLKEQLLILKVGKRVFVLRSMEIVQENGVYKFYDASVLFYMEDAQLK